MMLHNRFLKCGFQNGQGPLFILHFSDHVLILVPIGEITGVNNLTDSYCILFLIQLGSIYLSFCLQQKSQDQKLHK